MLDKMNQTMIDSDKLEEVIEMEVQKRLDAIRSATPSAPGAKDEYIVVPKEPTDAMLLAMHDGPLCADDEEMDAKTRAWLADMWCAAIKAGGRFPIAPTPAPAVAGEGMRDQILEEAQEAIKKSMGDDFDPDAEYWDWDNRGDIHSHGCDYGKWSACKIIDGLKIQHLSDCAVHNMPAMPNGPCDCGATANALATAAQENDRTLPEGDK